MEDKSILTPAQINSVKPLNAKWPGTFRSLLNIIEKDIVLTVPITEALSKSDTINQNRPCNEVYGTGKEKVKEAINHGEITKRNSSLSGNQHKVTTSKSCNHTVNLNTEKLLLCSWNVRSLNLQKVAKIISLKSHVICLQEIWNPCSNLLGSLAGTQIIKKREDGYGGTFSSWPSDLISQTSSPVPISEDSVITKLTLAGNRSIWFSSIYIKKRSKKAILEIFSVIKEKVPQGDWSQLILAGDWNINVSDNLDKFTQTLKIIVKQMGLQIFHPGPTRQEHTLDFIVAGRGIKIDDIKCEKTKLSDHSIVTAALTIPIAHHKNQLWIPNRLDAIKITQKSLKEARNSSEFLKKVEKQMKLRGYNILKKVRKNKPETTLLRQLLETLDEDKDLSKLVQEYWNEQYIENEKNRYSALPSNVKDAFSLLKRVFKYHHYDKRDGSIVTKILQDDGTTEMRQEEVDKQLINVLKTTQFKEDQPKYDIPLDFPKMQKLSHEDCKNIISRISNGKAIAYDGLSDIIFNRENINKTAKVFQDLWESEWVPRVHNPEQFTTRIVPLNKKHPNLPSKNDFRPISISSPVVKTLESKLLPKLSNYMTEEMHVGQTGFVSGQGILVNHLRLIQRVTERMKKGLKAYGLFIDFSNAYNTILHVKLYERLETVLDPDEIQLIKALYSRNKIKIGKESFTPNVGVAQGSLISPALFNIYSEDLYNNLDRNDVNPEDQMGYADDLHILSYNKINLRKVIQVIRSWSQENNLALNENKSGIMEFLPRQGPSKVTLNIGEAFEGIPVVACYKYLGMWVDQKLTMELQLKHIRKKSDWISIKLWPILNKVSLQYGKNLWTVLIRPLFEQLTILYSLEKSRSNKSRVENLLRYTFRKFTMLKKNISRSIIDDLMQFNIEERAQYNLRITIDKWEKRSKKPMNLDFLERSNSIESKSYEDRLLPRELRLLINLQTARCPHCTRHSYQMCTQQHLAQEHKILIPKYTEVIEEIERRTKTILAQRKEEKIKKTPVKTTRAEEFSYVSSFLLKHIEELNNFLSYPT